MDAKTGAVRWATEGREGEHASLLLTPQHVVFLTNSADLIVAKRGAPAFAVERRYEVAEAATWAMPVLLGIKYTGARCDRINATHGWKIVHRLHRSGKQIPHYCYSRLIDASVDGMFAFDRDCRLDRLESSDAANLRPRPR